MNKAGPYLHCFTHTWPPTSNSVLFYWLLFPFYYRIVQLCVPVKTDFELMEFHVSCPCSWYWLIGWSIASFKQGYRSWSDGCGYTVVVSTSDSSASIRETGNANGPRPCWREANIFPFHSRLLCCCSVYIFGPVHFFLHPTFRPVLEFAVRIEIISLVAIATNPKAVLP